MKSVLACVLFVMCGFAAADVSAKGGRLKSHKHDLKLIEAYSQKTVPGRRESPAEISINFIMEWRAKTYPETMFWRGEGGWQTCRMLKAHKMELGAGSKPIVGSGYRVEMADGNNIKKGDTMMVTPMVGGKFPIPKEIPNEARNTLFYKTGGSEWRPFVIDTIIKKRDILAP